jgi:hypothetical protein
LYDGSTQKGKIDKGINELSYLQLTSDNHCIDNLNGIINYSRINIKDTKNTVKSIPNIKGVISSIDYSPNGEQYVVGMSDVVTNYGTNFTEDISYISTISIYDVSTCSQIYTNPFGQPNSRYNIPNVIRFNPDQKQKQVLNIQNLKLILNLKY